MRRPSLSPEEKKIRARLAANKYAAANRDKLRAAARTKYHSDPEKEKARHKIWATQNVEHLRAYNKKRYKANPEPKKKNSKNWRASNPGYNAFACKRWVSQNREKYRILDRAAKARKKGASGSFTIADIDKIRKMQKSRCAYCRTKLTKSIETIDHITPLSRGGSNHRSNLQLLCVTLQQEKGSQEGF